MAYVGLVDRARYPEHSALTDVDIIDASKAVLNFTDRDFLVAQVVETRTFTLTNAANPRTGLVIVDIDDCDQINSITGLSENMWRAGTDGPAGSYGIFTYVEIAYRKQSSSLMGFTRNEDLFGPFYWDTIEVNARWGWPTNTVPEDVQRATLITAYAMAGDTSNLSNQLASKTVAEVTENYMQSAQFQINPETLPSRAAVLLDGWRRKTL